MTPIETRLETLRAHIASKGLALGRPLSPPAVEAFERKHGVRLPDDYRAFLLAIGDGGDGPPEYGLLELGARTTRKGQDPSDDARLSRPFPLESAWCWEGQADVPTERLRATWDGALELGTDGGGLYYALVVSGAARGSVWQIDFAGAEPCASDFLSWYAGWALTVD